MNEVWAAALLADSGAATPSIAPRRTSPDAVETRFSSEYDVNDASTCPPPGSTPSSDPRAVPRSTGGTIRRSSARFSQSPLTFW